MEDGITSTKVRKSPISQHGGEELSSFNESSDVTENIASLSDKAEMEAEDASIQLSLVLKGCEASSIAKTIQMPDVSQGSISPVNKCVTSSRCLNDHLTSSDVPSHHLNLDNVSTTSPLSTSQSSPTALLPKSSPHTLLLAETQEVSDLFAKAQSKIQLCMNSRWHVITKPNALHVVMLSEHPSVAIQRDVSCSLSGKVDVYVHCQPISANQFLENALSDVPLSWSTFDQYVDRIVNIVYRIRDMEVCCGLDDEELKVGWSRCTLGVVDENPYKERRFTETFRSLSCLRLVKKDAKRCSECADLYEPLKICATDSNTLDEELNEDAVNVKNYDGEDAREKMQTMIEKEGIVLDPELTACLVKILKSNVLSPCPAIFLEEHIKSSKKNRGSRWHPTLVRLAVAFYLTYPAVRETLETTGKIKLPCGRTLVDFSRMPTAQDSLDRVALESLAEQVDKFEHPYQKYHVIVVDALQDLVGIVFQKSTGRMVGFKQVGTIAEETRNLKYYFDNVKVRTAEFYYFRAKCWVFFAQGVCGGTKEVIATYPSILSETTLFMRMWNLINRLAICDVRVIAVVWNMCSVVRNFIKNKMPRTVLPSGVIFDVVNLSDLDRSIYFLANVPQLLNSIRNGLYKSRTDRMIGRRRLMKNGKNISWDCIIRLYKSKNERSKLKLNLVNVYPDNYARMDVKVATEVLNRNVAQALEDQGWNDASELVVFLRLVNNWYDCLCNSVGKGYTSQQDDRFEFLMSFLTYMEEWTEDANVDVDDGIAANKKTLSKETLRDLEMTTRSFIGVVKFLLSEGMESVSPEMFSLGSLEQYFKLRAGQSGGDSNKDRDGADDTVDESKRSNECTTER